MVLPILQNLKQEAKGKIHFYKINVDENPDIVEFLAISSVPSFLFIPTQGEKKFHSGAIPASVFKAKIKEHLNITLQN
jgi:thioredoxin-like negative regulator of GroEL